MTIPQTLPTPPQTSPLLEVRALSKQYVVNDSAWRRMMRRPPEVLHAVDNVSLQIAQGEILGLVGESGSGKTTLGRCLLRLIEPTSGQVLYNGQDILDLPRPQMQGIRRKMQLIFQDPFSSLNPRMTVRQALGEVLTVHRLCPPAQVDTRVEELLHMVGLPSDAMQRYPRHFSGGQRQRIGIARALAVQPEFIVADEPVSAVDVSIQAQVLNLLKELKTQLGLTMLFIAHDLSVVQYISTRVGVMYLGKIVEIAPRKELFAHPRHPYTQGLLLAAPQPDPLHRTTRVAVEGEPPSPLHPPPGCRFHTRCALASDRCRQEEPPLEDIGAGHLVACHHHDQALWPPVPVQAAL
jgi:oligopeptide/dipeptide ABC transporter ATP-binding protein